MFWHIDTDIVALVVTCALLVYVVKMKPFAESIRQNKGFLFCLISGVVMICVDIVSSVAMERATGALVYHAAMTVYLISQLFMFVAWFFYALTILFKDDKYGRVFAERLVAIPYAAYTLLALTNPWTGVFYTLSPDIEYARSRYFLPIMVGLFVIYAVSLFVLIFARRRHIPNGYPWAVLALTPLLLAVAIPVQLLHDGWLMIMPAYTVCLLLAFLFFQNVRVQSDRAQLTQFTDMVEHFACGVAICRIEPDGAKKILYVSKGLALIYNVRADQLIRRMRHDPLYGVYQEDRARVSAALSDMMSKNAPRELTYRCVTPDGEMRWVRLRMELISNADGSRTAYATFDDLTELKKAELLIDAALENTSVSIWEYDFKRRCIIQYQNSTEMHGFEQIVENVPESLVESGFVHPDSAPAFYEMYAKLSTGEPFAEGIFRVQTSDRSGYWYEHIRYTNQLDDAGRPQRAIGMSTDETRQQEAIVKYERELEKEKGLLSGEGLIVYASFDLTTNETLDYRYKDGTVVPDAQRTTFTFGSQNSQLLIDRGERRRFVALNNKEELISRYESGEVEHKLDYRRLMPDGSTIWLRSVLHLVREPRSDHYILFEYWYDIDEEKMRELMYRSIATDNYDFVARIDAKNHHFIVYPKPELTFNMPPLSGDDADDVTYSLYFDGALPEDCEMAIRNSLIDNVRENLKANGRSQFTYRERGADGSIRYKKITQYYIDAEREIIVMLREDITDTIRAELQKNTLLTAALDAANRGSESKSLFLSRVSHELRTPLNAIIGFLELSADADPETVKEYLKSSGIAAKQLLEIVNDVLDVSSIEYGNLRLADEPFDLNRVISALTDAYSAQCRAKGLVFEPVIDVTPETWLTGDELRISQILQNILDNAVKFTDNGFVRFSVNQYESKQNRVFIRFSVSDSGCGMSDELRERIFMPFEQESGLTAQRYGGSGLGLTIAKNLVDRMNGSIHIESVKGAGSTVVVELPLTRHENGEKPAADENIAAHAAQNWDFSGKRVLIAEDNPMNRMIVEMIVDRLGILHETAEDGKIALDRFISSKPGYYDAILMDIQMPNMDGYEATRMIRAARREDARSIHIIAVTANALSVDIAKSLSSGMNAHVSKPINTDELKRALANAFSMISC